MSPVAPLALWLGAVLLGLYVARRKGWDAVREAGAFARSSGLSIAPRLVLALLAASFLAKLVPTEAVGALIGGQSGFAGVLIAAAVGGLLPGGPMTSFPIAVFLWQFGAGVPQMVALLTAWSVFAFHRVLAYEIPMLGWRFSALRLAAVAVIPPLAGLLAMAAMALLGAQAIVAPPL